jgi:flagellar biosynthesis/type III secretory pathway M-ring protein FliF/YscJ
MPRVRGKRIPRWPWLILAVIVIAVVVFIVLWATGIIF